MGRRLVVAFCWMLTVTSYSMAGPQEKGGAQPGTSATAAKPDENPGLKDAESAFLKGEFEAAATKYRTVLEKDGSLTTAQVGLVRSTLRQSQLQPALDLATKYETASPNSAALHSVMGEVRFRRGEMVEAEREFHKALALDPKEVRSYLGLADIYDGLALHRMAYDQIQKAHEAAPDDPLVQRTWVRFLSRKERIAVLEKYLSSGHGDDAHEIRGMQLYLEYLKTLGEKETHPCRLAKPVESTETQLLPLMTDAAHMRGWGLKVRLNDHSGKFLVDTGASGLLMGTKMAEKAGVVRISGYEVGGIGDKGPNAAYIGYVNVLQIGELEFHDCMVRVVERKSVTDEDGLIGADVFASYLIGLNFREGKMKLEPLPKRPDEAAPATKSLNTEGGHDAEEAKDKTAAEEKQTLEVAATTGVPRILPKDRYVAPEMKTWTTVYRFGHDLLVPTAVNDLPKRFFLLDTGSFGNTFSTNLAQELGKLDKEDYLRVNGVSGSVQNVYRAQTATLQFGNLRQKNISSVTFDLTRISQNAGTEVSGILGFQMLNMLDLQIDYRDNLINFNYDPTKLGLPDWRKTK